jgi:hypothetical protein
MNNIKYGVLEMINSIKINATKKQVLNWSSPGGSTLTTCLLSALLFAVSFIILVPDMASAHGIAGNRFFSTTFTVDDPFISDEFSIVIHHNRQSGDPASKETDINIDVSKGLIPNFGFEFHEAYQKFDDGSSIHGWDNLGGGAKWQFLTNDPHELIMSIGTDIDIGGTGAHQVSHSFSRITPRLFFRKCLGELPDSVNFIRPFAVTGALGVGIPTRSKNVTTDPDTGDTKTFNRGFTLQYSLIYLQQNVKDIGMPSPFNRMILSSRVPDAD